jgi:Mn2+/Fe2+ NRAMP family transporter
MYWGRYEGVEKLSKGLAFLLGACLVSAAILSRPDAGQLVYDALHPVMPKATGSFSSAIVLMTIISSAVGGFGNLTYSAFIHEKGWRSLRLLRTQRLDLVVSMAGMLTMLVLIQVAAAGALRPRGLQVNKVEDLTPIFAQVLGDSGGILLGVLLWGVIFSSHVTGTVGNAIMLTDVWTRFIRPAKESDAETPAADRPFYKGVIVYMCLSPLYVFATEWTPVGLVLAYGVISLMALPAITGMLFWLTANRRVMGQYVNGPIANAILLFTIFSALYLGWQGLADLIVDLRKTT